ncbi:hypothetical protein LguiB_013194 [Lonicera macranthoides]
MGRGDGHRRKEIESGEGLLAKSGEGFLKPAIKLGPRPKAHIQNSPPTRSDIVTNARYIESGASEKTDVFGFGILLLELITGQRALEFGKAKNPKGAMLDWLKKIHQEKKLDVLVDKDLKNSYDRIELEEMVGVALLCTQYKWFQMQVPLHICLNVMLSPMNL